MPTDTARRAVAVALSLDGIAIMMTIVAGLLALRACIDGAGMNVRTNLPGLKDEKLKSGLLKRVLEISAESESEFTRIHQIIECKLG